MRLGALAPGNEHGYKNKCPVAGPHRPSHTCPYGIRHRFFPQVTCCRLIIFSTERWAPHSEGRAHGSSRTEAILLVSFPQSDRTSRSLVNQSTLSRAFPQQHSPNSMLSQSSNNTLPHTTPGLVTVSWSPLRDRRNMTETHRAVHHCCVDRATLQTSRGRESVAQIDHKRYCDNALQCRAIF